MGYVQPGEHRVTANVRTGRGDLCRDRSTARDQRPVSSRRSVPLTWFGKRRLHLRWYRKQVERSRQRFEELVARVKKLAEEVEEPKSEIAEADPGGPAS
jgi:hypothetical protein